MKLIVGLGNPGPEYDGTRHNVGFAVLDSLARRFAPGTIAKSKFSGSTLEADIGGEKTLLLKPLTFMNRSGQSVGEAVRFYKVEPREDLLIIVDDLALPCGSIRLRPEGSAGGHNGLQDVEEKLGTSEYGRLRIGIDGRGDIPQSAYVLGKFRPDQRTLVDHALADAVDAAAHWAVHGMTGAMNTFNSRKDSA